MILLDANVLLRLIQTGHPHQVAATNAVRRLAQTRDERLAICPQALYESYVVCTRPKHAPYMGLGLAAAEALVQLASFQEGLALVFEPPSMLARWKHLVGRYEVTGKSAHDTRLVALMLETDIRTLLTFNDAHFRRYTEIVALNPFDVIEQPRA